MDWAPTRNSPLMRPPRPAVAPDPIAATPAFSTYQRLPPAPQSMAARLRNPANNTPFFKAAETRQQDFFQRHAPGTAQAPNDGQVTEVDTDEEPRYIDIAPPKFFPNLGPSDTGLESLFTTAFRLGEEPHEVSRVRKRPRQSRPSNDPGSLLPHLISLLVLIAALVAWKLPLRNEANTTYLQLGALLTSTAIAIVALTSGVQLPTRYPSRAWTIITPCTELVVLIGAGITIHYDTLADLRDQAVTATLLSMIVHELKKFFPSQPPLAPPLAPPPPECHGVGLPDWRETTAIKPRPQRAFTTAGNHLEATQKPMDNTHRGHATQKGRQEGGRPRTRSHAHTD